MLKRESVAPPAAEISPPSLPKPDTQAKPFITLVAVASILILIAEFVVARSVPFELLMLTTQWSAIATMHGIAGGVIFLTGAISVYLGYRLLIGEVESFRDLQVMSSATAVSSLLAILLGNWIYIGYRAPGMVQDHFLETVPVLHNYFFEFKENIALFTFPLAFAAAFILVRYGDQLLRRPWLRTVVFMLLGFTFLFFLLAFGLGALITRLKPV